MSAYLAKPPLAVELAAIPLALDDLQDVAGYIITHWLGLQAAMA